MRGCYVALSHRWTDETSKCKTTQANYEARTRGVGFSTLSKNLRDVMIFAQKLGVRYVWIDSLCIIQDSEADVRQELLKMAQYYQNALCTLAIECQGGKGLLRQQGGRPFEKLVRLPYREAGTRKGYFYVYRRAVREAIEFMTEVDQCELLRRGWVCQEFFLSRRIIHIAPTGTYLECRSQEPLSMSNQTIDMILDWTSDHGNPLRRGDLRHVFKADFCAKPRFSLWYELAALYSQMILTEITDHLKAIAGIASEFALLGSSTAPSQTKSRQTESSLTESNQTKSSQTESSQTESSETEPSPQSDNYQAKYVSGLWLHDIHYGLLWQGLIQGPKVCHCGAPSWSWLSFAGPVSWFPSRTLRENACEILSVTREEQANPDLYLITQPSALILMGKMQPVLVHGYVSEDVYSEVSNMTAGGPLSAADPGDGDYRVKHAVLISPTSLPDIAAGWGIFDRPDLLKSLGDDESKSYMTLAFCVALRGIVKLGFKDKLNVADVLFVEPVEEGEGRFRRVGVGSIADPDILEHFTNSENMEIILL
ncbi:hypothetical protein MMC12_007011 [Toensbergia leucococca]|nr:hypothetical protein [Toensbergia leucococca]